MVVQDLYLQVLYTARSVRYGKTKVGYPVLQLLCPGAFPFTGLLQVHFHLLTFFVH